MTRARASAPGFIEPQLCELVEQPPQGRAWIHEVKFDGYRMQLHADKGNVRIFTRRGFDWTEKFPALAASAVGLDDCILDGELCAVDNQGISDFPALLNRLEARTSASLVLFAFDCLWRNGKDLRSLPLLQRKRHLAGILRGDPANMRMVAHSLPRAGVIF